MGLRNAARPLVAFLLAPAVSAEQLSDSTIDVNYPGLASACIAALNTTVECLSFLADASVSNDYLTADQLSALCVDGCKTSLVNVRTTVQEACTAAGDVIADSGIAYLATSVIDHFIYTDSISCLIDPIGLGTTGEFCDTLVQSWANLTDETSDCMLSMELVELNSPIGTTGTVPTANLMLGIAYCVEAVGDISMYANYTGGGAVEVSCLDASAPSSCFQDVSDLPSAPLMAGNVALPKYNRTTTPSQTIPTQTPLPTASGTIAGCSKYLNYQTVNSTIADAEALVNSCSFVASFYGVSVSNLLLRPVGFQCKLKSVPLNPTCRIELTKVFTITTASPTDVSSNCVSVPQTDIMEGTSSTCRCYTTVNGWEADANTSFAKTTIATLWQAASRSPWQSSLYTDLVNDAERAVCVKSDESSSTTPSTTATPSATATSPSSTAPTSTGSSATCSKEYTVVSGDSCAAIESEFGIIFAQFYSWNPDIGSNCEHLQIGNTYCVAGPDTSTSTTTTASPTTTGTAPTQTGIISTCKTFYTAVEGDSCWSIEQACGISADDFVSWNPAVGEDCSGLWLGYSYCVGV
ncbi:hypothetical protein CNMCM5878_006440 [Aspergillus fumigatiaffinis]|nr:hypothetical protein CNMCM5878_006440 [Aspergillus fumigatiaffinis]